MNIWSRRATLALLSLAVLALSACSPEASRLRGGGLGADPGNTRLPVELRGDRLRNNPSYDTPQPGRAPREARGVAGWWSRE